MMKNNPHQHPKRDELPGIFNLTDKQALAPRIIHTRNKLKIHEQIKEQLLSLCIRASKKDYWLPKMYHQQAEKKVAKLQKNLDHLNKRRRYFNELERYREEQRRYKAAKDKGRDTPVPPRPPRKEYSKSQAKEYPCRQILQEHHIDLTSHGFFKVRNERTASCKLYGDNSWWDHGTQEGGDSISLYMKINGCDFIEALRELQ